MDAGTAGPVIEVRDLVTRLGGATIHDGVSFAVPAGKVVALIGGSGSGKSVLLKVIIGLLRPVSGSVQLFGQEVWALAEDELNRLRQRVGMLFQDGALFSSLTVAQNVMAPLEEHSHLGEAGRREVARLKIALADLPASAADKLPNELSGGMRKRAALARALALDPELLFLDEPTSGLDPIAARAFDRLVRSLCDNLGISVFLVTHDLDTLLSICDEVVVLGRGKLLGQGTLADIRRIDDPWIRDYFAARSEIEA